MRVQKFVNEVLWKYIESGDVIAYMDDFMIATSMIDRHLYILRKVYKLLVNNLLDLRIDKCKFLYTKIEYLGYVVSASGISPTRGEINAVRNFSLSKNVREVVL